MKTYSIAILIDNRVTDVISYKAERRNLEKEMSLVTKFANMQVCNVKSVEKVNSHKLTIVSKQDITYNISWKSVTTWDETELED